MNEVAKRPDQIDPATQHMLDMALLKARDIEGTYLNDLEAALNMIRQYRRSLQLVCAPDPNGTAATDMLKKYNMIGGLAKPKAETDDERRERQRRELEVALDTLAAVRKDNLLQNRVPIAELTARADEVEDVVELSEEVEGEIVDAEVIDD